jgi:hypothetical protein
MNKPTKVALVVVAGIVALAFIAAISRPTPPRTPAPEPSTTVTATQVENSTTAQLGQPLRFEDVQILAGALTPGEELFGEPSTCSTVEYSNVGDRTSSLSPYDWKLQTPDGLIVNVGIGGSRDRLPFGEIAAGGAARGDVCFDVEVGNTGSKLTYEPFSWSGEKLTWMQP